VAPLNLSRFLISAGFVLVILLTAPAASARKPETGFLNRVVTVQGDTYRYQVYVPADYESHKKWPVILFLHGAGERGDDGLLQTDIGLGHAIREHAANFPFIVVMPQCRKEKAWTQADMQAQALAALDQSFKEFHGDRERVYLTGLSMGGYGTWDLAVRYPKRFAAYIVICGGIRGPERWPELHSSLIDDHRISDPYAETARRIGKTPVWIFHGADDPTIPVEESRKMADALRAAGGNVQYTEYPGVGHQSWLKAYAEPDLVPWLLKQKLNP
jgi:predicted peptidase